MEVSPHFLNSARAFSWDYPTHELADTYVANLRDMVERFEEIEKITPTEDLTELHQDYVNSSFVGFAL